ASAVAESVLQQRGQGKFRVIPIPTRVDKDEKIKLDEACLHAQRRFEKFLETQQDSSNFLDYWGFFNVPYVPFYAFEEILAPFGDLPGQPVLTSAERLAGKLTDRRVTKLQGMTESLRKQYLNLFLRKEERHREDLIAAERRAEEAQKQVEAPSKRKRPT